LIRESSPKLWITHGLSGSGKTTGSEAWVAAFGAIRIRSDVERKRLLGLDARERAAAEHYDSATSTTTYQRLQSLARAILSAGYPVIVDATFLRENDRRDFRSLADQEGVPFEILHFTADEGELRDRITQRAAAQADASDADLAVLRTQLATQQPLTAQEQPFVIDASANRPL
jgi:predicted kinase